MRQKVGVLGFALCLNMTANSMAALAADAGLQQQLLGLSLGAHQ